MVGEYFPWAFHHTPHGHSPILRSDSGASSMSMEGGDPSTPPSHFIYTQVCVCPAARPAAVVSGGLGLGTAADADHTIQATCVFELSMTKLSLYLGASRLIPCPACSVCHPTMCGLHLPPTPHHAGQPQVCAGHRGVRQAAWGPAALPDHGADAAVAAGQRQRSARVPPQGGRRQQGSLQQRPVLGRRQVRTGQVAAGSWW